MNKYSALVTNKIVNVPKKYTGSYWGSQKVETYPKVLIDKLPSSSLYVDLTTGGGAFPYWVSTNLGLPVVVNDRNYYAHVGHKSVFEGQGMELEKPREEWFDGFCSKTHPDNIKPLTGFMTTKIGIDKCYLNAELAAYIDGYCTVLQEDKTALSALGRTIINTLTFRSYSWCKKGVTKRNDEVTPHELWLKICRMAWRLRLFGEKIQGKGRSTYFDALEAVTNIDLTGAFVYIDPAWPWPQGQTKLNPYAFFSYDVGGTLAQKEFKDSFVMWNNLEPEHIINDVSSWVDMAFQRGAAYFCVSTQSPINFPPAELVYDRLGAQFNEVTRSVADVRAAWSAHVYQDWFVVYSSKK